MNEVWLVTYCDEHVIGIMTSLERAEQLVKDYDEQSLADYRKRYGEDPVSCGDLVKAVEDGVVTFSREDDEGECEFYEVKLVELDKLVD